jgi:hypothetical protein
METEEGGMLLRLAHLYEVGEDGGEAACVDVSALFGGVSSLKELALTGVPPTNLATRRRWPTGRRPSSLTPTPLPSRLAECAKGEFSVVLHAMDIRTFEVELMSDPPRGHSTN